MNVTQSQAAPHWSVPALSKRWGCSRTTTYSTLRQHKATMLKLGRLSRIPNSEVERIEQEAATPLMSDDEALR